MWKFGLLDRDFTYKKFHDGLWSTHAGGTRKKIGHADVVINVIDFRQEYPQAVVKQALAALGFTEQANQLKHVSYGVVSLSPETAAGLGIDISSGKHAYAMSGRQGIGIKVAELVEHMEQIIEAKRSRKVGISSRVLAAAAIRYYLLKVNIQTEVVFDLQQATEVSGNSGIYLLYSYARANRVLANAVKHQLIVDTTTPINLAELEPQEYELLRHIAYWEETFEAALKQLTPHVLCSYAFELASLFSHFYGACPIIKGPENKLQLRLWLTSRFKETLHQVLQVLGMPTPKRM
ncbi:Arginine--tRNA ligase [compost metagenome]